MKVAIKLLWYIHIWPLGFKRGPNNLINPINQFWCPIPPICGIIIPMPILIMIYYFVNINLYNVFVNLHMSYLDDYIGIYYIAVLCVLCNSPI